MAHHATKFPPFLCNSTKRAKKSMKPPAATIAVYPIRYDPPFGRPHIRAKKSMPDCLGTVDILPSVPRKIMKGFLAAIGSIAGYAIGCVLGATAAGSTHRFLEAFAAAPIGVMYSLDSTSGDRIGQAILLIAIATLLFGMILSLARRWAVALPIGMFLFTAGFAFAGSLTIGQMLGF